MTLNVTASRVDTSVRNDMTASNQWSSRPASERFWNVSELHAHFMNQFQNSTEQKFRNRDVSVVADNKGDLMLQRKNGGQVRFTNWSFNQFVQRFRSEGIEPPRVGYLRSLAERGATERVVDALNFELQYAADDENLMWYNRNNGINRAMAISSKSYARVPNYRVAEALMNLPSDWRVPPARPAVDDPRTRPATADDILSGTKMGLSIKIGDPIAPAGVYGDDRNMFVFMVNESRPIEVSDKETLFRGFYVGNSEVGESYLYIVVFDYDTVCGNHIIWGQRNVREFKIKHTGNVSNLISRFRDNFASIQRITDADTSRDVAVIRAAQAKTLGKDREEVSRFSYDKGILSLRQSQQAYDIAEQYEDIHGNPNSIWGFFSGITRLSQMQPYADVREQMDKNAARLLKMAEAAASN